MSMPASLRRLWITQRWWIAPTVIALILVGLRVDKDVDRIADRIHADKHQHRHHEHHQYGL